MKHEKLKTRDLGRFLKVASKAAVDAGQVLKKNAHKVNRIKLKGEINLVTEMDIKSQQMIISFLKGKFPTFSILAEEDTEIDNKSEFRWIIDPLDGTTNYAHGFPFWCVSIGLEYLNEMIIGVIYDPVRDELYTAAEDRAARMNGKKIAVSRTGKLSSSLLATGFPYDVHTSKENNLDNFSHFQLSARAVRRAGSAALDLCYLAIGRFDGFWELKLHPWDTAAGIVIVRQAGGRITDFEGKKYSIYGKKILASNGKIHRQMMAVLRKTTL